MNFDYSLLVILALGMLLGLLVASKAFRIKFFKGLRKFLIQLSSGARAYTAQQQRGRGRGGGDKGTKRREGQPYPGEVKHRYTHNHHLINCPNCEGTGRLKKKVPKILDSKLFERQTEECPDCEGTGKVYD